MRKQMPKSDGPQFECPKVTDEDIRWASFVLNLPKNAFYGTDGNDPRQAVLKSMERIDVAACPGSGKTTLLVAKLAILAQKWRYRTRGICVLSHTNAARTEIETKLGNTAVGRQLLSYPHHIGTIHGFVDEFLALPWLWSRGYQVKMIDTDVCLKRRWYGLPHATRGALEKNSHTPSILSVKSPDFGVGKVSWGKGELGADTSTAKEIRKTCQRSAAEGYFCYDEMFMWARDLMDKVPGVVEVIRDRFPLLFIDEAQDNSEDQSAILVRIFMDDGGAVVRQRFGDGNQAIFDSVGAKGAKNDIFPDGAVKKDLPNSHRFGQKIADLADPLGIVPYVLKGQGPKKPLASGAPEGRHTIFLFNGDSAAQVLDAFADLLIETFSDSELRDGTFWAIGQVHRPPIEEEGQKFPHHIGHYWPRYDPELTKTDPHPETFVQYIFAGQEKAKTAKETYPAVEKMAEGLLRLASMVGGSPIFHKRRYSHRYILELLEAASHVRGHYQDLIAKFALVLDAPTKETWDNPWCPIVREITETLAGAPLSGEATAFLEWKEGASDPGSGSNPKSQNNIYQIFKDGRRVEIRVGSIHSVKGRTHTATLVLETYWKDRKKRHNLELLSPWLRGIKAGRCNVGVEQQSRLKVHYVAATRPTHLLCLAMKRSSFEDDEGNLNQSMVQELEQRGWQVKSI
jgi:DNA helicase-2/ATP-dependent DNA helicase PcrA